MRSVDFKGLFCACFCEPCLHNFDQAIVEHGKSYCVYWLRVSKKLIKDKNRRRIIRDLLFKQ